METNLRALFSIFIEKRLLRWDSNPRPPAFKAVALPTESPRQPHVGKTMDMDMYLIKLYVTGTMYNRKIKVNPQIVTVIVSVASI